MGENPYQAVHRAVLRGAGRVWHDLRFKDLYRSGEEFELMTRAMGFAALAILTVIPLLIVVAAADPAPERGLAVWVIDGMGLSGSSADAVALVFSAPGRVLGTTSVFGVLLGRLWCVVRGQRAGRVREDLGSSPPGRGPRSGGRWCGWPFSPPTSSGRPRSARWRTGGWLRQGRWRCWLASSSSGGGCASCSVGG